MAYSDTEKTDLINEICNRVSNGEALRTILKEDSMPKSETFYRWIDEDENKSKQYEKSRKSKTYIDNTKCRSNPKGSKAIDINDYRRKNARNTSKSKYPNSNLYIIKIESKNIYKIGVSQNPQRRFRDIENSMPYYVEVVFNEYIDNAYKIEEQVHDKYKNKHIKSEWFKLSNEDINQILCVLHELKLIKKAI
ncbi:MAG: GIY-YIG nuclease family protein [Psychroserpens sp.]|nr:GIY-YIG nuclease family protein [Psychroserpens sp.]